jgi:large subunit ribosomal protein L30
MPEKEIKVTLVKSLIGTKQEHRACVRGLGLRHRNHSVTVCDTPENRGMITRAGFLLKVSDAA